MTRRYGPVEGAGVAVIEQDGDKTIIGAPLGVHAYIGVFNKGDVNELISAPNRSAMLRKVGGLCVDQDSEAPDAALDFHAHANGAGELFFVRVTDGTEVASSIKVFGRHAGHGWRYGLTADGDYGDVAKVPLFTVSARNGGRWGGRKRTLSGNMDPSTDLQVQGTVLVPGITGMVTNEWKGATIKLRGISKTYTVISNDDTTFRIATDSNMDADRAASDDPDCGYFNVYLDQSLVTFPTQSAGTRRGLGLVFRNGRESETELFGMDVYEDEVKVASWDNLSMDPNSKWYIGNVVDDDNYTDIDVLYTGAVTNAHRPANWYGYPLEWSGGEMFAAQVAHVRSVTTSAASPGWVGDWKMPSDSGYTNLLSRHKLTITFTGATTFTVASASADGTRLLDMPSGTVGTAYAPRDDFSIGFTVHAGTDVWATGNTIVIDVDPFPVDADGVGLLAGWSVYPDDDGAKRSRYRIESNTNNSLQLSSTPSESLSNTAAWQTVETEVITFPLTLTSMTVIHSFWGKKTLALSGSPFASRAAFITAINTAWHTATSGTNDIASASVTTGKVKFSRDNDDTANYGYESFGIFTMAGSSATAAQLTGSNTGATWNLLASGKTLLCKVDGNGAQTATFTAVQATRTGGAISLVDLNGDVLTIKVNGGVAQAITFTAAASSSAAAAAEINSQLVGGSAAIVATVLVIKSDQYGTGSSIEIVSGTGSCLTELGLTANTVTGSGNVANILAVTQAEVKTILEAAFTSGSGVTVTHASNAPVITSNTTGVSSSIEVTSGTARTIFGFDTVAVTGVDGEDELDTVSAFGTVGTAFRIEAPTELVGGYDGYAPSDADFIAAANVSTSPLNRLFGRNKGLVKLATPGKTATAIQQAFLNYAEARNYQYRVEVPSGTTDESDVVDFINDTIGRNDFGVVAFPSYAYVPNPAGAGVVLRSLTGAIQGREALMARNWQGYHKAAAGIDVTLPTVIRLPTGAAVLNEELLNPVGVQVIKKAHGNFIVWGDRTISLDPAWKFKHHREYMSHLENIFREQFDFIVFALNDKETRRTLITTITAFLLPEWKKRALRGDKFTDAVSIKIDDENNTNATMAAGDLNAQIKLRLADTVERFVITMSKAGIFEDLGG